MARKLILKRLGTDPRVLADLVNSKEMTIEEGQAAIADRWIDYRQVIADILAAPEDPRAGMSGEDIRTACAVANRCAKALGNVLMLEDADYETLARKVKLFRWGGNAHPNIVTFLDDLANAEKVDLNEPKAAKGNGKARTPETTAPGQRATQ